MVEIYSGAELAFLPESQAPRCRRTATLVRHPAAPCPEVQGLEGWACLLDGPLLSLGFTLRGDLDRLNLPQPGVPRRSDRLWEHTCFEAFLALPGQDAYWELNLSPATEWAAYAFQGYRKGGCPAPDLEPRILVHRSPERLELHAVAPLPALDAGLGLQVGLSAVIEALDGRLSHWAIRHAPGRPDFHHRAAFALELTPGAQA